MVATDAQIKLLTDLFNNRQVDAVTHNIWGRQLELHVSPWSPVQLSGWQASVLIENFLKLPRRNLSYVGRRRR
jgi:hypothetical protein